MLIQRSWFWGVFHRSNPESRCSFTGIRRTGSGRWSVRCFMRTYQPRLNKRKHCCQLIMLPCGIRFTAVTLSDQVTAALRMWCRPIFAPWWNSRRFSIFTVMAGRRESILRNISRKHWEWRRRCCLPQALPMQHSDWRSWLRSGRKHWRIHWDERKCKQKYRDIRGFEYIRELEYSMERGVLWYRLI